MCVENFHRLYITFLPASVQTLMNVLKEPTTAVHKHIVLIQTEDFSVIVSLATQEMESVAVSHTNEWFIVNPMTTHTYGSSNTCIFRSNLLSYFQLDLSCVMHTKFLLFPRLY